MVKALIKDVENELDQILAQAQKAKPDGAEIPGIIAKIWFQLQRLNVELTAEPETPKGEVLTQLEPFMKKLLENLRKAALNLGLTSFSIDISPHLAVQVTLTWQLSPLIVA
ncbi:MAG: hypothetical protein ACFFB3_13120 [Candidatus Hodarchaeota archaeon]